MCLSPEADVIAAVAIGVVAVDTYRRNANPDAQAIAAIPAIFAVHSIASAIVWWDLRNQVPDAFGLLATWFYIFVAFVLWPIYIPIALRRMETSRDRRAILFVLALAGAMNSAVNFSFLVTSNFTVTENEWFIQFSSPGMPVVIGWFYGIATCASMFVSSHRELMWWGVVNLIGIVAIYTWAEHGLPSLWCFWAAITSVFINWFIRHHSRKHLAAIGMHS